MPNVIPQVARTSNTKKLALEFVFISLLSHVYLCMLRVLLYCGLLVLIFPSLAMYIEIISQILLKRPDKNDSRLANVHEGNYMRCN
jgi:hypothetical protein